MGLNRAFDRPFFVIGGNVKTSGGSLDLAKGQLALIDQSVTTANGAKVVATTAGKPKDAKDFVLRLGVADREPNRSYSNKDESTMPFSLNNVVGLTVSAPERTEQSVDEVIIGYDGMNPNTAFNFKTGDSYFRLSLELKGGAVSFRGGKGDTEVVNINVEVPECDPFDNCVECTECDGVDCKTITLEAIERLKKRQLSGGLTVDQLIDITPVFSCDTDAVVEEIPYNYYCLEVCDTGTDAALALVQAQVGYKTVRIDRVGSTSKYQILIPATEGAPSDYVQQVASLIKGCEDCPADYAEVSGGYFYAVTIEDDGTDLTATFAAAFPTAIDIIRADNNNYGVGFYTLVMPALISQATIDSFVAGAAPRNTATFSKGIKVASLCEWDGRVSEIAWTLCGTCNVIEETYTIVLPDNTCGDTRLDELNAAYDSEVVVAETAGTGSVATITGAAGGIGAVEIGTETYVTVFDTNAATTAANFVDQYATVIYDTHGITVTDNGDGTLTFASLTEDWVLPTWVETTPELDFAFSTPGEELVPDRNACQTRYSTTVISNIVCEECDPIFKDYYVTEAPESYDTVKWEKVANPTALPSGDCLCGIRFKSREFILEGDEALRDLVGFTETSTQIRVAAGYPEEIREGIGRLPKGRYEPKYLSRWIPRTHLAGNLRAFENEGRAYFRGLDYRKDYLGRLLRGETSNMEDQSKQYVQYTLKVSHFNHTQGFAGRINEDINYDIFVEVGLHQNVENLLNNIASAAGISTVQAFGV
jgi:hypothetical protein